MKLTSESFAHLGPIQSEFAFGKRGASEPCVLSDNRSPQLAWSDVPAGTRSFVLMCVDADVPTRGDDVNQAGRTLPRSLPRTDFIHWLMVDIALECRELVAGSCSDGITARGKRAPPGPPRARQGINDYTAWFANDHAMSGDYYGYDGPCPPWNDELIHHYHFRLYALDLPELGVSGRFSAADVERAMHSHVLAQAELTGTYALNPAQAVQPS